MCRFVAFRAEGEVDPNVLESLIKASDKDPYSSFGSHPDGWGFVIYFRDDGWSKIYYTSRKPIFKDPNVKLLSSIRGDELVGIIHARRSSKKFLLGPSHAHPYFLRAGPYELFLAHNGSISRVGFTEPNLPYTDSFVMLMEVAKRVQEGMDPVESYSRVTKELRQWSTSLNSSLLFYGEGVGPSLYVYYYYNKEKMREKEEYYRLYRSGGYIFSSSVNYYLRDIGRELPYDELTEL
jgi:Predicted glutamine amidotransferase